MAFIKRYPLITFYALVFLIEWVVIAPLTANQPLLVGLIAFVPTIAALLASALIGGKSRINTLVGRVRIGGVGLNWYLVAIGVPFAIHVVATGISLLLGSPINIPISQIVSLLIATIILAAGEEIGWRGFALPELLRQRSALLAATMFGVLHALFHLPLYLLPLPPELREASSFWLFLVMTLGFAMYSFWLYNHTRGSVLIGIVFHASINISAVLLTGTPRETLGWLLPAIWAAAGLFLAVVTRTTLVWRGATVPTQGAAQVEH